MSIEWNDNLTSGSPEIDTQHKELFHRINRLLAALETGGVDRQEISNVIQYLSDYVVYHFGNEEKYMARSPIPAGPHTLRSTSSS